MSSAGVHFGQSVCARGQDRTRNRRPLRLSILGSLFVASFQLQSTKRTLCDLVPQRAATNEGRGGSLLSLSPLGAGGVGEFGYRAQVPVG